MAAARRLIARRGYAATSIETIAKEAGVAVPTVYKAFGTKRAIALALNARIDSEAGLSELIPAVLSSADAFLSLTRDHGWSLDECEAWLTEAGCQLLLDQDPSGVPLEHDGRDSVQRGSCRKPPGPLYRGRGGEIRAGVSRERGRARASGRRGWPPRHRHPR